MDKPPLHTRYYALDVAEDWQSFSYICKENVMDQMDRYNFAAANWAYTLEDLEEKTFSILLFITGSDEATVAQMILDAEAKKND